MSKRAQIQEAVRAGLLPREQGDKLLARLPAEAPAPPVREGKMKKVVDAMRAASTTPPPPAGPATPEPPTQDPAPVSPPSQPQTIVVHDSSANWRIVAAILASAAALVKIIHACI